MTEILPVSKGIAPVNGTHLYYEMAGAGHPFVLIHGGLVDHRLWDEQFQAFAQHYRVVRYDLRSYSMSAQTTETYTLVDDHYSLMQFLGIEKAYLMGLSMGGSLAIDFTLAHPEMVDALIPVAAGVSGFPPSPELMQQFAEVDKLVEQGELDQAVELENRIWTDGPKRAPEQVNASVRTRVYEMNRNNYAVQQQTTIGPAEGAIKAIDHLGDIHVPTLVFVGDQDQPHVLSAADTMIAGIADARKVVIPNTAHHPNMEQPALFNQIVLDFLASL